MPYNTFNLKKLKVVRGKHFSGRDVFRKFNGNYLPLESFEKQGFSCRIDFYDKVICFCWILVRIPCTCSVVDGYNRGQLICFLVFMINLQFRNNLKHLKITFNIICYNMYNIYVLLKVLYVDKNCKYMLNNKIFNRTRIYPEKYKF